VGSVKDEEVLFDKEFISSLPDARQFENPWLVAMCKMDKNQQNKELIEKWFSNLTTKSQPDFKKRLRSLKNSIFIPAYYELMMHQFCLEEGWEVEYEPVLDTGFKPDLLVTTRNNYKFIIEVLTVFDSDAVDKSNSRQQELTHLISNIKTQFILSLHYKEDPSESVKTSLMINSIKSWLSHLDSSNPKKIHKKTFKQGGYNLSAEAMFSNPIASNNCVWTVMEPGGMVPNYSERIKSGLDDKSKKFGSKKTKLPLVVMIADGVGRIRLDEKALDKTLFGDDVITFSYDGKAPPKAHKSRNGYFTPSNDAKGQWVGRRSSVSAVLYCSKQERSTFQLQMFHNPLPFFPLDNEIFYKVPQLLQTVFTGGMQMRWVITNPEDSRIYFN